VILWAADGGYGCVGALVRIETQAARDRTLTCTERIRWLTVLRNGARVENT